MSDTTTITSLQSRIMRLMEENHSLHQNSRQQQSKLKLQSDEINRMGNKIQTLRLAKSALLRDIKARGAGNDDRPKEKHND